MAAGHDLGGIPEARLGKKGAFGLDEAQLEDPPQ